MTTLIILDWDDTLFPTSWAIKNNIDITNEPNKYLSLFSKLDNIIANTIYKLSKYGKVIIITNALPNWIHISLCVLPKTHKILKLVNVNIISARAQYQSQYSDMMEWKKRSFKKVVSDNNKPINIISIGDADYEYKALIDLNNHKNKKILKAIKLMNNPTYKTLVDQLCVLYKAIHDICTKPNHIDWKFKEL